MPRTGGYRSNVDVETIPTIHDSMVSTGTCASLVQHHSKVDVTSGWKEGALVKGSTTIKRGTAIATFVNGKYPNEETGNHAAFYVSQAEDGLWIVEQFKSLNKPQKTKLSFQGKNSDGKYVDPSNNGDAFSIIEL
jgi:hypothetical protein